MAIKTPGKWLGEPEIFHHYEHRNFPREFQIKDQGLIWGAHISSKGLQTSVSKAHLLEITSIWLPTIAFYGLSSCLQASPHSLEKQ